MRDNDYQLSPDEEAASYYAARERHADALEAWYNANRAWALEVLVAIDRLEKDFCDTFDADLDSVSEWQDLFRIDRNEITKGHNP
jgi:hypothetical protein